MTEHFRPGTVFYYESLLQVLAEDDQPDVVKFDSVNNTVTWRWHDVE